MLEAIVVILVSKLHERPIASLKKKEWLKTLIMKDFSKLCVYV